MSKKGSYLNVWTYLIVLFVVVIFIAGVQYSGRDLIQSNQTNLDNDSLLYILQVNNVDVSNFTSSQSVQEDPLTFDPDQGAKNPKDYALDFLYAKEKFTGVINGAKLVFNVPSVIVYTIFRFNAQQFSWVLNILGWLLGLILLIAGVFIVRGLIK